MDSNHTTYSNDILAEKLRLLERAPFPEELEYRIMSRLKAQAETSTEVVAQIEVPTDTQAHARNNARATVAGRHKKIRQTILWAFAGFATIAGIISLFRLIDIELFSMQKPVGELIADAMEKTGEHIENIFSVWSLSHNIILVVLSIGALYISINGILSSRANRRIIEKWGYIYK